MSPEKKLATPTETDIGTWSPGRVLSWYLMCSYLYYICDFSLVSDSVYDTMAKKILANYESIDHQHKYLVSKDDLAAGTLYSLKDKDYPTMVKNSAERLR